MKKAELYQTGENNSASSRLVKQRRNRSSLKLQHSPSSAPKESASASKKGASFLLVAPYNLATYLCASIWIGGLNL